MFQSAPPHGGRRQVDAQLRGKAAVSIRAPARGATSVPHHPTRLGSVSIRAPARGATSKHARDTSAESCFNPRPRTGGDVLTAIAVSCFNPRPRTGGDTIHYTSMFQSAPPHGGRLLVAVQKGVRLEVSIRAPARGATSRDTLVLLKYSSFNPRPRTGGDEKQLRDELWFQVSIRAPARGATDTANHLQTQLVSIRAPARGATGRGKPSEDVFEVSIRAPARGATAQIEADVDGHVCLVSIRAPARGATGIEMGAGSECSHGWLVSIRAPARGATSSFSNIPLTTRCFNPRPRTGSDTIGVRNRGLVHEFQSAPPHGERQA